MDNTKVAVIKTKERDLFMHWLTFIRPFHNLSKGEMKLLATLLYHRHKLKKVVSDQDIVDTLLFSTDIKKTIMGELKYNTARFNNELSSLRKKGAIVDNKIKSHYIPNIKVDANEFSILLKFKIDDKR